MFRGNKKIIKLTEHTVRQLMVEIDKAKAETTFTNIAMPDENMTIDTFCRLKKERGEIMVSTEQAPVDFFIQLEIPLNA